MAIFNFSNSPSKSDNWSDVHVDYFSGLIEETINGYNLNDIYYKATIIFEIKNDDPANPSWVGEAYVSQPDSNDPVVVIPSASVEVWARTKLRGEAETPLAGISYIREYNVPCTELLFSDFIDGRNALLTHYLDNLGLNLSDWEAYISELIAQLSLPLNSPIRQKAISVLMGLLREAKLLDKAPTPGTYWYITEGQKKLEWVQSNLSKELFKIALREQLIPLVLKAYPRPEIQYLQWVSGGEQILVPICDDYKGVCCLYDEEEKEIAPGLFKTVKVYKDCISDTDKATCLNQTKRYSQSSTNATFGQYDGADFFNDNEKEYGCELCKSPTSIVYCCDGVAFIHKDLRIDSLKSIINSSGAPKTNIQYFANAKDAQAEYNRMVKTKVCSFTDEPKTAPPPSISVDSCDNTNFSIEITPSSGCLDNYINYDAYINNNLVVPDSISWNPGPVNSSQSLATMNFIGNYIGSTVFVKARNCVKDESDNSIRCGQQSTRSNIVNIDCQSTPTPLILNLYPLPE